jgi:hypothetical protein
MKRLFVIIFVVASLVAFAAPVFADKKGVPNDNACWGQVHKIIENVSEEIHANKDALPEGTNWGQYCKEVLKPIVCGD